MAECKFTSQGPKNWSNSFVDVTIIIGAKFSRAKCLNINISMGPLAVTNLAASRIIRTDGDAPDSGNRANWIQPLRVNSVIRTPKAAADSCSGVSPPPPPLITAPAFYYDHIAFAAHRWPPIKSCEAPPKLNFKHKHSGHYLFARRADVFQMHFIISARDCWNSLIVAALLGAL